MGSIFVSFGGGGVKKVTSLQTPEVAAWSHALHMQRLDLECFKGLLPAQVAPTNCDCYPFTSPLICRWLAPLRPQWAFLVAV